MCFVYQNISLMNGSIEFHKKIGEGSYGVVYKIKALGRFYALKIEKRKGSIENEVRALATLRHSSIPQIVAMGMFKGYKFIVIPYFKLSVVQLLLYNKDYFTSKVVAAIAWNIVDVLKTIHSVNMIHRDIKPENIMIDTNSKIYLVDFGMCVYRSEVAKGQIRGTLRYASINTHKGNLVGPRDDLESLGYLLVFLLMKTLPWLREERNDRILQLKTSTNYQKLGLGTRWESLVIGTVSGQLSHESIKARLSEIYHSTELFRNFDSGLFCCN